MAVNELERDYIRLLHTCDIIENIIGGMKMSDASDSDKKMTVGNLIMHIEEELVDSKYTDAKKDLTRVNSTITKGRTYWKS